jgi:dihydroflavonol-4-reductase
MTHRTKLVMGGSGFLGSTVTRMLVEQGERVRVFLRPSSSTTALTGLDVEVVHGDLGAPDSLRRAMEGIEDLFYCIVDTRAWLRDPAPLFQTNVEALRTVLDVALEHDLNRFVFTSTIGTLAINRHRAVTEQDPHNWIDQGGAYIQSRVQAEELVLAYAHERGLPAVAMCVAHHLRRRRLRAHPARPGPRPGQQRTRALVRPGRSHRGRWHPRRCPGPHPCGQPRHRRAAVRRL